MWPFPAEAVAAALEQAQRSFVVENNATGQFAGLIRRETGREVTRVISRYDGRPFVPEEIAAEVLGR